MLVNTVILFVKDILPICVLLSVASTVVPKHYVGRTIVSLLSAFVFLCVCLLFYFIEVLGGLFGGDGVEIFNAVVTAAVYVSLLMMTPRLIARVQVNFVGLTSLAIALGLFTAIHLSEFLLYFLTFLSDRNTLVSIVIGSFFGIGICLSFSALFFLFLTRFLVFTHYSKMIAWGLYLASFVMQLVTVLQQIGQLSTSLSLWDSTNLVADDSEYGYLLNTLLGYISSPTVEHVLAYLLSLVVTSVVLFCTLRGIPVALAPKALRSSK